MTRADTVTGDRENGDLPLFAGVAEVVGLVDRLCERPRFGDDPHGDGLALNDRRKQRGLPLVCVVGPSRAGEPRLLPGLAKRLTDAVPRPIPHSLPPIPEGSVSAGSDDEVERVRQILTAAAQELGSSRNASGGRIRFRRFGLLAWLMSQELTDPDSARRSAKLRTLLRERDVAKRFDEAVENVGKNVPQTGWLGVATRALRLLPPLLFVLRVSGRVPLIGGVYRWFLRQPYLTPEVPGGFPGFAERLVGGDGGWRRENKTQVARLLTNAFLEDLRRSWRSPWRLRGPRRMTYAALLLDGVTEDNGGSALLRLVNHVRNETSLFDPLLVVSFGEHEPPEDGSGDNFTAEYAGEAYTHWLGALPDARRARTARAWYLRIEAPAPAADSTNAKIRQRVAGLHRYKIASPPWWGRRIVPVGLVLVVLAGVVTGYVSWSRAHCGDGVWPPSSGSTLEWTGTQCIGVTDGHHVFDPALADVTEKILEQNEQADGVHGKDPARAYITVADLQALTPPPGGTDGLAAERESLEGVAVAQAQALRDPAVPLLRVLIANGGTNMERGTTVAGQLRDLPTGDAPLVGVIGLDHSTQAVDDTVLALAIDGLPTIGASLSEDQLADSNPLYYQVSPQNRREAAVAAAFATTLRAQGKVDDEVEVFYPDDPGDTYAQNLVKDAQDSFGLAGFRTKATRFAPSATPPDAIKPGILYPVQNGKNTCGFAGLVYYAGDGVPDFNAFLDGVRKCPTRPALLADDDVTRYVADTAARQQNQSIPFWYTTFATAPTSAAQGAAGDFYDGPVGLNALFPHDKGEHEDPSLDGHAALSYDATQVLIAAVLHLRLGNASIPITPGHVWREISGIRSKSPQTASHPDPNNDALQGVTGLIDFTATGASLHYPANKQITILPVSQGEVREPAFFCGAPDDPRQSKECPPPDQS